MRPLKAKEVIRAFERANFVVVRTSGSHHIIMKIPGQEGTISVPVHGGKELKRGTLGGIIRQSGLTQDEFWALVDS
jgi:predicted RNA binding protein YcfA (HicA-like mRNA interferase family)